MHPVHLLLLQLQLWEPVHFEVHSLLHLIFTKQGTGVAWGVIPLGIKEPGPWYVSLCWAFCKMSLSSLSKQTFLKKISQNISPAPFGQKQMATPTLQISCYFICCNAACRVWPWLFLSLSIDMFVESMIHKSVKQKAPIPAVHLVTFGAIFILSSANHPG